MMTVHYADNTCVPVSLLLTHTLQQNCFEVCYIGLSHVFFSEWVNTKFKMHEGFLSTAYEPLLDLSSKIFTQSAVLFTH